MQSIYDYVDFRKFLSDSFDEKNKENKKFSKSYICREMGVPNSRSYFTDIIGGDRALSNAKAELLVTIFELDTDEAQYFRLLVQYNQTMMPNEKKFYLDQLLRAAKPEKVDLNPKFFALYGKWYHSSIRALLDVVTFTGDCTLLAEKLIPTISVEEIEESIALLLDLKLIEKNEDGCFKPTDSYITSGNAALHNEIIKQYQIDCIELSKNAVYNAKVQKKNISTKTISVSDETYDLIRERLNQFKEEVSAIIQKDEHKAENVYQLNIQLFSQA